MTAVRKMLLHSEAGGGQQIQHHCLVIHRDHFNLTTRHVTPAGTGQAHEAD